LERIAPDETKNEHQGSKSVSKLASGVWAAKSWKGAGGEGDDGPTLTQWL